MNTIDVTGGIIFLLGFIYAILGFIAYFHIKKEKSMNNMWTLSFLWALNKNVYDEYGAKLCNIGKPLFFIVWIGFIFWLVLRGLN